MLTTMLSRSVLLRRAVVVLAVSGVVVLTSCGTDDGLGRRYAVSGNVTYNGEPLEKGLISFVPEETTGVGATSAIEKGAYALSTGGEQDGARVGKYKVAISAREDSLAKAKADFQKASGKSEAAVVPKEFLSKAAKGAKSFIPEGYGDVRSTNLVAEVKAQSNSIDFKLTDADAPPAPKGSGRGAQGK